MKIQIIRLKRKLKEWSIEYDQERIQIEVHALKEALSLYSSKKFLFDWFRTENVAKVDYERKLKEIIKRALHDSFHNEDVISKGGLSDPEISK
jgi:hypothetical protein